MQEIQITQNQHKKTLKTQAWSLPTTAGLEMEWDYSGRNGRDGQNKKIDKAYKKKVKKRVKDGELKGQGGKEMPQPHTRLIIR